MTPRIDPYPHESFQNSQSESSDDVFNAARFTIPLQMELDAAMASGTSFIQPKKKQPWESHGRRRKIRFSPNLTIVNPSKEYFTDEDVKLKWLAASDLRQLKVGAKELSNRLRKSPRSLDQKTISIAHRKTTLMLKADFKALTKLSSSTPDEDLVRWCQSSDGRRGLERFSSRDYAAFRQIDIGKVRAAVRDECARQKESGIFDPEAIAAAAQQHSRRARTFARFLGAADASTAVHQRDSEGRRALTRCHSEAAPPQRGNLSRKKSKTFHQADAFQAMGR